ncbi:MAG: UDP-N-acetylmuramoyl-L-alanine--D-glutamate ligase [Chloroflexi bacterium]|nr:UDP-N-acetylmuramoyl-L-alanine--D-glutamate ligase [Chloroflexota bacterium]MCY3587343.1 UDP-N-acetylmuramoyl-L-alanine--D-glutamate ligase [Chloroflexota bacterium]MCY3686703.1 UDP-N-acetylmuramoyl-L-alanine--D-glutamate ligase [Chloroflexota bacterium]MDE2709506.1 UDP-N-acetylmuramoyl-L-alanine--D-glutamate ligase [Chloroflexota bacterium]
MTLPTPTEAPPTFNGQKVAVVGLGIEGRDAVTFLEREGSEIVRVDRNPEQADRDQDDLTILDEVDGIIASQGVHYQQPLLAEADRRGVPVYGPTQIFLERCPAPVIGITGSAGKTTTTTLVHLMLQAAGVRCQVGGNIGRGLLAQLPDITATDTVVAELSHTQLLRTTRSPRTAAITNITPNHLDQFSWEEYQELKYRIVEYQSPSDTVVLPFNDELAAAATARTEAGQRWFGIDAPGMPWYCAMRSSDGKILHNDRPLMSVEEIKLPGEHNLLNALAALAIVADLVPDDVAIDVLRNFSGVPHRLELIAEIECVRFINDSIATTPERTLAGLRATSGPIILLLGGRDKNLPLDPLIDEIRSHVRRVVLFGESAPGWTAWLRERDIAAEDAGSFGSAVRRAADCARSNDTVLMSPGGTSFDAYPNFEARGRHFRDLVEELARASEVVQ